MMDNQISLLLGGRADDGDDVRDAQQWNNDLESKKVSEVLPRCILLSANYVKARDASYKQKVLLPKKDCFVENLLVIG